jgi:hypothetical protein
MELVYYVGFGTAVRRTQTWVAEANHLLQLKLPDFKC